jgi:hypothetical protein
MKDQERNDGTPRILTIGRCLVLAALTALVGATLRLAKPVEPPDAAFLERVESWNRLAPELEAAHHLERGR